MKKGFKVVSLCVATAMFFTSCSSYTTIKSIPDEAEVYVNGEFRGKTPYKHSDTKLAFSKTRVTIKKDGYKDHESHIQRNEKWDGGAIIGGLIVWPLLLWMKKYNEERTYKLEPGKTYSNKTRGGGDPLKGLNVATKENLNFGKYYALIVGIDKYSGDWNGLDNAVNDARAMESMLSETYSFDQINSLYNENATRAEIIKQLEWLVANVKETDNVFIYYSGHGEYKKELNKGYWVPSDATTKSTSEYISNSDIQTFLGGIKSKHTLLVSDACFSGDIFRGNTLSVPFEDSEKYYKEVHKLPSRQALTSGGIEPVMDGGKDGHSVFAYYMLKSLRNNTSKYYDVSQLFANLKIPVVNNSDQIPKLSAIKKTGDEGGQFIFIKK